MGFSEYTLGSAGFYLFRKLDVLNNNLANLNTAGFKRDKVTVAEQRFEDALASKLGLSSLYGRYDFERYRGSSLETEYTVFDNGPLVESGNPLDAALQDPTWFFIVETPTGTALTRAGNFTINSEGQLVTQAGYPVQGVDGSITVGDAGAVTISPSGKVVGKVGAETVELGSLSIVKVNGVLEKIGSNLFKPHGELESVENPRLATGYIEQSNVEIVPTMLELIATNRTFDFYTRVIKALEEINQGLINSGG